MTDIPQEWKLADIVLHEYAYENENLKGKPYVVDLAILRLIADAAIAKCAPLIEKREQARILEYLKGLLKSTPKASLAATIDLIEATKL